MSHTTHTDPIVFALSEHVSTVDNDGPAAYAQHASDAWKLNAPTTVDGPTTAPVTSVLRAFVNYPTLVKEKELREVRYEWDDGVAVYTIPRSAYREDMTEAQAESASLDAGTYPPRVEPFAPDYSDGYGGTYAKGE